ncbi:hypothetical protein H1Q63_05860 [Desmonostoc muscorum CCALA 125]|nr:hypothetical protein [Desmonostoc muscorum CCALA 125]
MAIEENLLTILFYKRSRLPVANAGIPYLCIITESIFLRFINVAIAIPKTPD